MEPGDVQRFLAATNRPFAIAPGTDVLQCRFDDGAVSAMVAMRLVKTTAGSPWLAMSVPICPVERVHLRAVLVANDELPLGVLAERQGVVVLRQTLPMASLTTARLDEALRALVRLAALLVATAADPAGASSPYAYLFFG